MERHRIAEHGTMTLSAMRLALDSQCAFASDVKVDVPDDVMFEDGGAMH